MLIQGLVILICVMLFGLGVKSMFTPKSMTQNFSIQPEGIAGLNTIRGVIGGFFIASLSMLITGLVTGQNVWFLAVAILLGVVAVGRLIGLIADGFEKSVVPPLLVEMVMVGILATAYMQLGVA